MPWNIVLLPLLGGFWFITIFYPTRFSALQLSRERLVFWSASTAIALAIGAKLLTLFFIWIVPDPSMWVKDTFFPWPLAGIAFLAFILGPTLAKFLNRFFIRGDVNERAIKRLGDPLEKILLTASISDDLVMISMKSGKVYVGLVTELPANLEGRCPWLSIVPYFSGFRDSATKEMIITTNYSDVIEKFQGRHFDPDDDWETSEKAFQKAIRVEDIEVCGIFIPEIWNEFQDRKSDGVDAESAERGEK